MLAGTQTIHLLLQLVRQYLLRLLHTALATAT
jgi:hypothetical protein